MKYLHSMVRVTDLAHSLAFYRDAPGRQESADRTDSQRFWARNILFPTTA